MIATLALGALATPESRAYASLRRHPELFDGTHGWAQWIDPLLLAAVSDLEGGNSSAISSLLREETEGVYSFQFFSDEFCRLFLDELDGYYASGLPAPRPNSMNNYGIIVNSIGMRAAITWLQTRVLHPIAAHLYPVEAEGGFDGHHSFMVQYRADQDLGLDMHTDDSDVTFNICLGREFTGASLTICGDSRQPRHRQFYLAYRHERGRALVHLGSRRHGADDIETGERNSLIVWNQNSRYRNSAHHINRQRYHSEEAAPDGRCLSYTHDRDYAHFREYPLGKEHYRGKGWCPPEWACYDGMEPVSAQAKAEL